MNRLVSSKPISRKIKGMEKLIDEYELLSNKQNKTTEESKRLETITTSLKSHFKGASMEVNAYSGSLQLSVQKMRELNAEQKRNYEISARQGLKEAEEGTRASGQDQIHKHGDQQRKRTLPCREDHQWKISFILAM